MSGAAVAISTAALILATASVVLHFYPIERDMPEPRELPSPPPPAKTQDPPPVAPPPKPPEPAAQPEGPRFSPHPMFASYMTGIDPADILERYNTDPSYRSWFNGHFGALTIRQAAGFDASPLPSDSPAPAPPPATVPALPAAPPPSAPAPVPDPAFVPYMTDGDDPQIYVNRYNSDPAYREWFDANFEGMTIQQAAGLRSTTPSGAAPPPSIATAPAPATPPPVATPPPEPDNSAECNRLLAQLFNVNTPIEEFDRIEAELVANSCSG